MFGNERRSKVIDVDFLMTYIEIQPLFYLQKQILGISILLSLFLIREGENKP